MPSTPGLAGARVITLTSGGGHVTPATKAEREASWQGSITETRGGHLRIFMAGRGMVDSDMAQWCAWFETFMKSARKIVAQDVNFSGNALTSAGVRQLLSAFTAMAVEVQVLKLWNNRIGKGSGLAQFFATCNGSLRELHLSNNVLDSQAMYEIMVAAAAAKDGDSWSYPKGTVALWLRLENNCPDDAEALNAQFLAELTRLGRKRSCLCHVTGSTTCNPRLCAFGTPAIHLTYFMSPVGRAKAAPSTSTRALASAGPSFSVSLAARLHDPRAPVPAAWQPRAAGELGPTWRPKLRDEADLAGGKTVADGAPASPDSFPALGTEAAPESAFSFKASASPKPSTSPKAGMSPKVSMPSMGVVPPIADRKRRNRWLPIDSIAGSVPEPREDVRLPSDAPEPEGSSTLTSLDAATTTETVSTAGDDTDIAESATMVAFEAVACCSYKAEAKGYCSMEAGEEVEVFINAPEAGDVMCSWPVYVFICASKAGAGRGWVPLAVLWLRYVDESGRPWLYHDPTRAWQWETARRS